MTHDLPLDPAHLGRAAIRKRLRLLADLARADRRSASRHIA